MTASGNEEIAFILLYRGYSQRQEPLYAYLAVRGDRLDAFLAANASGELFDITAFGTILTWGHGLEPSDEVKAAMEAQYGYNHAAELPIAGIAGPQD